MTKAELKEIVQQLDANNVPDGAEVLVRLNIDNSRIKLEAMPFIVEGADASFSVGPDGHWAQTVSQVNAVVLLQK